MFDSGDYVALNFFIITDKLNNFLIIPHLKKAVLIFFMYMYTRTRNFEVTGRERSALFSAPLATCLLTGGDSRARAQVCISLESPKLEATNTR